MRKVVKYGKNCVAVTLPDEMVKSGYTHGAQVAWNFKAGVGWVCMKADQFIDMTMTQSRHGKA